MNRGQNSEDEHGYTPHFPDDSPPLAVMPTEDVEVERPATTVVKLNYLSSRSNSPQSQLENLSRTPTPELRDASRNSSVPPASQKLKLQDAGNEDQQCDTPTQAEQDRRAKLWGSNGYNDGLREFQSPQRELHVPRPVRMVAYSDAGFPEVEYDKVRDIRGMNITICTSANDNEKGYVLLQSLGFPFREN